MLAWRCQFEGRPFAHLQRTSFGGNGCFLRTNDFVAVLSLAVSLDREVYVLAGFEGLFSTRHRRSTPVLMCTLVSCSLASIYKYAEPLIFVLRRTRNRTGNNVDVYAEPRKCVRGGSWKAVRGCERLWKCLKACANPPCTRNHAFRP